MCRRFQVNKNKSKVKVAKKIEYKQEVKFILFMGRTVSL